MIGVAIPMPVDRKHPTKREVARLIIAAREIEAMSIHAHRERCGPHHLLSQMAAPALMALFPRWLRNDHAMHARINAPAARLFARRNG